MSRRTLTIRLASLLGATVGITGAAHAQTTLFTFDGDGANDRFGAAVARAGDFNNDGFTDIIVGAPENNNVFQAGKGYARVFSGQNGAVLATFDGLGNMDAFGHAVAGAGDVNGDGFDDVLIGARLNGASFNQGGSIRVISGQTMAPLYEITGLASGEQLGASVSGCGDVDGDGVDDFVGGAPTAAGNFGMARVYSGATSSILHSFTGTTSNGRLGFSVGLLDDVNGDGRADILVGSLFDGVYIYSGMDGTVIRHFTSLAADDVYGKSVSGIDDMDNDGIRDVVIGATQESVIGAPGPGYIEVRSSVTGALLLTKTGTTVNHRFGASVSGAGDWNGDSKPDVVVGSVPTNALTDEYAVVLSGIDGTILASFQGDQPGQGMGYSVAGLGDVNGDGKVDIAFGAPDTSTNGLSSGRARVYSGPVAACGGVNSYCTAGANSVSPAGMSITGIGTASVSSVFFLNASGGPVGEPGLFFYGATQSSFPFGNGTRCIGGTVYRLSIVPIGAGGTASLLLDYAGAQFPIVANSTWNFQFWYRDPAAGGANFNLTDAVEVNFCP